MTEEYSAPPGIYPRIRMRRSRRHAWSRRLVREHALSVADLIWPAFVCENGVAATPVASMPGVVRHTIDQLVEAVGEAKMLGVPAVAIFPVVPQGLKSVGCEEAWNPDNLACRSIRAITAAHPDIGVICDVALDPYNADGHDGLVIDGDVANDQTVAALCRQALVQAQAGCPIVAPSDMMDGRVGAIRDSLDGAGHQHVQIMAYAAKYASAFYGPFRDAVDSTAALRGAGKDTYQMDPANTDEALREVALDLAEGADMVMVKPGLPYLDVLRRVKERFGAPTFVYQVSGEYAMLRFAADAGALDWNACMMEALVAFKRAGADGILTYCAIEAARLLNGR